MIKVQADSQGKTITLNGQALVSLDLPNQNKTITENGTYTADSGYNGLGTVTVNVPSTSSTKYGISIDSMFGDPDANGKLLAPSVASPNFVLPSNIIDLGNNCLSERFANSSSIKTAVFQGVKNITGDNALYKCFSQSKIQTVSFPELENVTGDEALYQLFYFCSFISSITFPKLKTIGDPVGGTYESNGRQFGYWYSTGSLTELSFPELTTIYCTGSSYFYGTFYNCTSIKKFYFPKLTQITYGSSASSSSQSACNYIFSNCSALTEIHFGSANQAAIEATTGYSTIWGRGAGNATIYFDL